MTLDAFDQRILAALQGNARASNLEIGEQVSLSHSAVSRRIARLEAAGIIKGYAAQIDLAAVGITVRAFVQVTRDGAIGASELACALRQIDGVNASYVVTGGQDVFLDVVADDLPAFSRLMLTKVQATPGVATTQSIFVMQEWPGTLPLSHREA